jgi:hypothetical protein
MLFKNFLSAGIFFMSAKIKDFYVRNGGKG